MGAAAGALGLWLPRSVRAASPAPQVIRGRQISLDVGETTVNFTGAPRIATTINNSLPGPILRLRQGDTVSIQIRNHLRQATAIHWHGILLPYQMDGVPGISFEGIAPGASFTYRFTLQQSGTYWYHSHAGYQEQSGLYGALIVDPSGPERFACDRDYVLLLSDWSDSNPAHIYAMLKRQSDVYNTHRSTLAELLHDAKTQGLHQAIDERSMWSRMRMDRNDLSDVSGAAYTYLINGQPPADSWTGVFRRGERVRLRLINGSSMSIFDLRIPGLKLTVISADGQDIEPVTVDELRLSIAETYDVMVEPQDDRAYTIFAQSIDRSGYACATLTPQPGLRAEVPPLDPRVPLSMHDMMGDMGMQHGMDMHGMVMKPGMSMAGMHMPPPVHHALTETGPNVDMRVDHPRTNLDDPGVGLRNNGRRVLSYADLHTIGGSLDTREPQREIELHLTGNMERYLWSFDGVPYAQAKPIHFPAGERVRMVLVNDSMMNHPIHLHGMWSELENAEGGFQVRKHTINVQPAQRVAYGVSANALGRWAYHCHMQYHMDAGMFREVVVA